MARTVRGFDKHAERSTERDLYPRVMFPKMRLEDNVEDWMILQGTHRIERSMRSNVSKISSLFRRR